MVCLLFILLFVFFNLCDTRIEYVLHYWKMWNDGDHFIFVRFLQLSNELTATRICKNRILQSVLGRNKCMCCSSHALCYGRMWLCAIHNSFASYDGDVILISCTNKADCQGTQTLSTWSHRTGVNFPFLREKRIQYFSVSA